MFVIGTAGHVDHGKSTLVTKLTGIDPDRLPEEKARGLTIDLGFAWLTTPTGIDVGIVDVPGHERFVKNMIAGAGGIDAALFVVAADDGWMPQSDEHLAILKLLHIQQGIIVLTKVDLVKAEWLTLVIDDILQKTKDTFLQKASLVKVSSVTGEGLDQLRTEIDLLLKKIQPRRDLGKPRLFVDRVFGIAGRGTVVTGTLIDGSFASGEDVEILPQRLKSRIRSLQSHKKEISACGPGTRLALNLSAIEKENLTRGNVVLKPGQGLLSNRWAGQLTLWQTQSGVRPYLLKDNTEVLFFLGTFELRARVHLCGANKLYPGETAVVELTAREPLVGRIGDHFILRLPSPPVTLGGGTVLDLNPGWKKRKDPAVTENLQQRARLDLENLILAELSDNILVSESNLLFHSHFSQPEIKEKLNELEKQHRIVYPDPSGELVGLSSSLEQKKQQILNLVRQQNEQYPFRLGLNLGSLPKALKMTNSNCTLLVELLIRSGQLVQTNGFLHCPGFTPRLLPEQLPIVEWLFKEFSARPFAGPTKNELLSRGEPYGDLVAFLIYRDDFIECRDGVLLRKEDVELAKKKIGIFFESHHSMTVSQFRDLLQTSRKYAVPILEKLDQLGFTKRIGDERILTPAESALQ